MWTTCPRLLHDSKWHSNWTYELQTASPMICPLHHSPHSNTQLKLVSFLHSYRHSGSYPTWLPSVLWCCWLGGRKGIWPVKNWVTEWWGAGMVICLERGADLHMAQLMPLPLTVSCFSKIQIGFTFLVPAHLGIPGRRAVKRVCVCVCVCTVTDKQNRRLVCNIVHVYNSGFKWVKSYNNSNLPLGTTMPTDIVNNTITSVIVLKYNGGMYVALAMYMLCLCRHSELT